MSKPSHPSTSSRPSDSPPRDWMSIICQRHVDTHSKSLMIPSLLWFDKLFFKLRSPTWEEFLGVPTDTLLYFTLYHLEKYYEKCKKTKVQPHRCPPIIFQACLAVTIGFLVDKPVITLNNMNTMFDADRREAKVIEETKIQLLIFTDWGLKLSTEEFDAYKEKVSKTHQGSR